MFSADGGFDIDGDLGELGLTKAEVAIHQQPDSFSMVYYTAQPSRFLVVNRLDNEAWLGVVMKGGVIGYARTELFEVFHCKIKGAG